MYDEYVSTRFLFFFFLSPSALGALAVDFLAGALLAGAFWAGALLAGAFEAVVDAGFCKRANATGEGAVSGKHAGRQQIIESGTNGGHCERVEVWRGGL
jgi:hypothetical protein